MKVLEIKVLKGPNYWSVRRLKLIQMKLDLEEMEQRPTNTIPGFRERLEKMFPTLYEHHCSEGKPGGFFSRVEEGTWMGHVIEHVALELQTLSGMDTGFGRTRGVGEEGVYYVVFSYMEEDAGVYAARASVQIVQSIVDGTEYDLEKDVQQLREIRENTRLGPSTGCIVEESAKRGIPFIRLNKNSLVQLGYGIHQKRIRATIASTTGNIAVDIACFPETIHNGIFQPFYVIRWMLAELVLRYVAIHFFLPTRVIKYGRTNFLTIRSINDHRTDAICSEINTDNMPILVHSKSSH